MYTARDRTIGILFGNIVVFVIFTTIWPVSVANVVRTHLARALERLAALVGLGARNFRRDLASRSVRGRPRRLGRRSRRHVRSWSTIRSKRGRCGALSGGGRSTRLWWSRSVGCSSRSRRFSICVPIWPGTTFRSQCTTRFARITRRWQRGSGRQRHGRAAARERVRWQPAYRNRRPCPARVITSTAFATWYGVLHQDIRKILDEVGPQPQPVTAPSVGDALHAAG